MLIKELKKFTVETLAEIKELQSLCNNYDRLKGTFIFDTSLNFNEDMNTIFLMYHENKLISGLVVFAPGKEEGEIKAVTHPDYRKQGCFTELLNRAEAELKKYGVPDILFVCERKAQAGKLIAEQKGKYDFTEYMLTYNHSSNARINNYAYRLKLHEASEEDLDDIIKVSMSAFGDSYEEAKDFGLAMLNTGNRRFFLGELEGEYIAMGVTYLDEDGFYINGLGVLSEYQGKGYGKEILYLIIKTLVAQEAKRICLEVDSQNANAFRLYQQAGFEVESEFEYYRNEIK